MDLEKRSIGFGAAIIIFALLLRLLSGTLAAPTYARPIEPEEKPLLKVPMGLPAATAPTLPPPETTLPPQTVPLPVGLTLGQEDVRLVRLRTATDCGYSPDLERLLLQALHWDLDSGEPTVLIYHSHACEAYTKEPGQMYTELINCRTTATDYNMVAVGEALARLLEEGGITVIHDRQLHDEASYANAYHSSRASVEEYLEQYPSIRLVLDLHRDAAVEADGSRYAALTTVDGLPAAQIMFVVGTDYSGSYHPAWQENLSIALKLQALMERQSEGITRASTLRGSRFNQDVAPGALLIEVGASGNTLTQVYRALPILANAIIALRDGANLSAV